MTTSRLFGYRLFSSAGLSTGVTIAPGSSAWASVSDVTVKENFRDLDGEEVLARIARMPIREWNYKAQDAAIRHVGPTAQDFYAAFGLGEDPLRISTVDADGIALRAIQALEARARGHRARIRLIEQELSAMREGAARRDEPPGALERLGTGRRQSITRRRTLPMRPVTCFRGWRG